MILATGKYLEIILIYIVNHHVKLYKNPIECREISLELYHYTAWKTVIFLVLIVQKNRQQNYARFRNYNLRKFIPYRKILYTKYCVAYEIQQTSFSRVYLINRRLLSQNLGVSSFSGL